MADRNVKVVVKGDVADFLQKMGLVERAADKAATSTGKVNESAKTGLSGMAQSIRDNQSAWTATGGALTAYGAAVTGIGAVVLKTGVAYNTLRQTSVAALTTLTGSAEAANAQMAKLDDFASNSPFSRATFIEAQQQLIGFGMEAENVLPTLDAIQNAVAAFGGSNQDIAELAFIVAQVGAAGKITGQDLMQFGQRGVDAAGIIGEQMGKTGAQIREEITAGTLGADEAIAALTTGMSERFGGAAANVKETFAGAFDRVKAAFRDLAATVAEPLVSATGGGFLQDALNGVADFMRTIERLPDGVIVAGSALAGLSGMASLAAGGFLLLAPRAVETWDALGKMGSFGVAAQTGLKKVGSAAALAAGPAMLGLLLTVLSKVGQGMLDTGDTANELENKLRQLGNGESGFGLIAGAEGISDFNAALAGIADPSLWQSIDNGVDDFFNGIFAVVTAGHDGREAIDAFRQSLPDLDAALAQMAGSSLTDAAQGFRDLADAWNLDDAGMLAALDSLPAFRDHLVGVANDMGVAATDANLLALATGEIAPPMEGAAGAAGELAGAVDDLNGAFVKVDPSILQDAAAEASAANQAILQSFINLSEDIGNTEVSLDKWWAQIEAQMSAQAAFVDNIAYLRGQGMNEAFVQGLLDQGAAGAMRTQQIVDAMTGGDAANAEWIARGEEWAENMHGAASRALDASDPVVIKAEMALDAAAELGRKAEFESIFTADPVTIPVEANDAPARATVDSTMAWVLEQNGTVTFDADGALAHVRLDEWNATAANTTGMPTLDADPAKARAQVAQWLGVTNGTVGTATLDANGDPAHGTTFQWERDADSTWGTANLDADPTNAYAALRAFANAAANTSVSIGLSANGRAGGGPIFGPGTGTSDSIPAIGPGGARYRLSNNEHVLTAAEVAAAGGHGEVYRLRKSLLAGAARYDIGGVMGAGYASRYASMVTAPAPSAPAAPAVYVQNPWTGEYLEARTVAIAQHESGRAMATATRRTR